MSDARYAPYGADDDPFLTHPAGAGQARSPAPRGEYDQHHPYWQADHSAAGGFAASSPRQSYAQEQGYDPAGYALDQHAEFGYDQPNYDQPHYDQPSYDQPRYDHAGQRPAYDAPAPQAYPAQSARRGNFISRSAHGSHAFDDQPNAAAAHFAPAPMLNAARPQLTAQRTASFAAPPRTQSRAEPTRQPLHAQPAHMRGPVAYAPPPLQHSPDADPYAAPQGMAFAPSAGGLVQWAGALCTVAVIIGVVLWGYELAMRDANGIPVVRAAAGPLRIAPETPGGEISAHQGLAVNAIPAAISAPAVPDQITLAPQPQALAQEDLGAAIVENGSFAQSAGEGSAAALDGASDMARVLPETNGGLAADLTALPDALPEDMPMTDAEAVERALEAALAEGGDFMAEPMPSPIIDPVSMAQTDPIAPPTAEMDPATIALGTPLVQLGAFDSDATARSEWANLQTRFTELMAGKALVVEPAKSGGRDFFRLRAYGFDSADDTRRFCAAVLAENGSCFPVDQR